MKPLTFRKPAYRPTSVPMPEDLYAVTTDPGPLHSPAPENARAHAANACQIAQYAVDEGRGLTFDETVAVRNRLIAALEQLDGQRPRLVVDYPSLPQADGAGE